MTTEDRHRDARRARRRLGGAFLVTTLLLVGASVWAVTTAASMRQIHGSLTAELAPAVPVTAEVVDRQWILGLDVITAEWTPGPGTRPVTVRLPDVDDTPVGDEVELVVDGRERRYSSAGGVATAARHAAGTPDWMRRLVSNLATWLWGAGIVGVLLAGATLTIALHHLGPQPPPP